MMMTLLTISSERLGDLGSGTLCNQLWIAATCEYRWGNIVTVDATNACKLNGKNEFRKIHLSSIDQSWDCSSLDLGLFWKILYTYYRNFVSNCVMVFPCVRDPSSAQGGERMRLSENAGCVSAMWTHMCRQLQYGDTCAGNCWTGSCNFTHILPHLYL